MTKAIYLTVVLASLGMFQHCSEKEYEIRFTESQLQDRLSERLPVSITYFVVVELILDNPRLALKNGSNRVNAGLDIRLIIHYGSDPRPLDGTIDVSGGIRYQSDTGQFFLTDPMVEHFAVPGLPDDKADKIDQALTRALTEYYSERPIYTLNAGELNQAVTRMVLKRVIVENRELVVTLGI